MQRTSWLDGRRYRFHGDPGNPEHPTKSGICDHLRFKHLAIQTWSSLARPGAFQLGDHGRIFLLPKPEDEYHIYPNLPDIPDDYLVNTDDCENKTRRRLVQLDDFLKYKTDIPERIVWGIAEIRGMVWSPSKDKWTGHSMLMTIDENERVGLRDIYNPLIKTRLEPDYMKFPWLVYQ